MTVLGMGFIVGGGPYLHQKVIGYSHGICAASAPMGGACQVSHCCILQGPQLGKVNDCFSPPVVCMAPSSSMSASQ